jgi:signal transduction histidine kinase
MPGARGLAERAILEFATAGDVRSGMTRAVAMLRRAGGATRVEWWAPTDDGSALRLEAVDGTGLGQRLAVPAGPAGVVVLTGARCGSQLMPILGRLTPILRHRFVEEELARRTVQLARRNEALEDFAALVAHELKAPLLAALRQEDASAGLESALDIVDELLELSRGDAAASGAAHPAECLDRALADLGPLSVEIVSALPRELPLPPAALRLLLRNFVANAVAAGAQHIRIAAAVSAAQWSLVVDDDGVGPAETNRYAAGSGLGLSLCRGVAARFGAALELAPGAEKGARATLRAER